MNDFNDGIEAAAMWHDREADNAKAIFSTMRRYSDDAEERSGWRSYKNKEDRHRFAATSIRSLRRPDGASGEVQVKPLEWSQRPPPGHEHEPFVYWAAGLGGYYSAERDGILWMAHDGFVWEKYATQKDAKAAAQRDYEQRIRSAIVIGATDNAVREAYRALCEPRESQASDNLEGALYDIKRYSAAGKPTDDVCVRTIERVITQVAKAEHILSHPAAGHERRNEI